MTFPAVLGAISKILGGVSAVKGLRDKPNRAYMMTPRYGRVGDVAGVAGSQPTGLDRARNTLGTVGQIAGGISALRGLRGDRPRPYQIQYGRR